MRWRFVLRCIKLPILIVFAVYLLCVAALFIYTAVMDGVFVAGLVTDAVLVRGPVLRLMHPVASDEKMIKAFQAKRKLFERLIDISESECLTDRFDKVRPDVILLNRKIGLISSIGNHGIYWFTDPYSDQAVEELRSMDREAEIKLKQLDSTLDSRQRNAQVSLIFEELRKKYCRYESVRFVWENFSGFTNAKKGIQHFPVDPKVENGVIHLPRGYTSGETYHYEKVLENLDGLPKGFWPDQRDCTFRKIEPKWFLFVCPL